MRALACVLTAGLLLTACAEPGGDFDAEQIEIEDCDREDALQGDRDCSKAQIDKARKAQKAKSVKPKKKPVYRAPKTRKR